MAAEFQVCSLDTCRWHHKGISPITEAMALCRCDPVGRGRDGGEGRARRSSLCWHQQKAVCRFKASKLSNPQHHQGGVVSTKLRHSTAALSVCKKSAHTYVLQSGSCQAGHLCLTAPCVAVTFWWPTVLSDECERNCRTCQGCCMCGLSLASCRQVRNQVRHPRL